ncbi:hypothetical protein KA001_00225 [Patescibacteria group bacterium]|nr:hypothetical protein [Patescibacteria group bacterium]
MELTRSNLLSKIRVAAVYERNQQMVLSIISLLLFVFFTFVFFIPSVKSIFGIIENNKELEKTLKTLEERQKSYQTITNYYNEVSKDELSYLKLFSTDGEPFSTLGLINNLALNNNIFLSQANLGSKDAGTEEYTLKFSGSYSSIISFLDDLDQNPRFFYLKNIELNLERGKFSTNLETSANLIGFYVY